MLVFVVHNEHEPEQTLRYRRCETRIHISLQPQGSDLTRATTMLIGNGAADQRSNALADAFATNAHHVLQGTIIHQHLTPLAGAGRCPLFLLTCGPLASKTSSWHYSKCMYPSAFDCVSHAVDGYCT